MSSVAFKNPIYIAFLSIFLGIAAFMFPGMIFCFVLTAISFFLITNNTDTKDKNFIIKIICIAIGLRVIALVFIEAYIMSKGPLDILGSGSFDIIGDGSANIERGIQIAYLNGEQQASYSFRHIGNIYGIHGKIFFNQMFFSLFGKDLLSLKYVNSLSIVISGWFIYSLIKNIYSPLSGKIAISLYLFWPTLFAWSITDLKESHIIFSIVLMLWCINKLIARITFRSYPVFLLMLLIIAAAGYAISLRIHLYLPLISAFFIIISIYYAFQCQAIKARKKLLFLAFTIASFILLNFREEIYHFAKAGYGRLIAHHMGVLSSGGWNYNLLGYSKDYYSIHFFIYYLSGAWFHFMLEPLPWHYFSLSMLASFPQMVVWYGLIVMSMLGIMRLIKAGKSKEIFPPLVFLILYVTIVGMTSGNIGTVIRFRDTITPFIIMFASCGIASLVKPTRQ